MTDTATLQQWADDEIEPSLAELHYRLGKRLESRPGVINRPTPEAPSFNSNERVFEGLSLDCVPRIPRSYLTRVERQQADAEWDAIPSDPKKLKKWMRGDDL